MANPGAYAGSARYIASVQMIVISSTMISNDHHGYHGRYRKFATMLSDARTMPITRPQRLTSQDLDAGAWTRIPPADGPSPNR